MYSVVGAAMDGWLDGWVGGLVDGERETESQGCAAAGEHEIPWALAAYGYLPTAPSVFGGIGCGRCIILPQ